MQTIELCAQISISQNRPSIEASVPFHFLSVFFVNDTSAQNARNSMRSSTPNEQKHNF